MSDAKGLAALVLAGSRSGGDSLADYAGVTHKALISVCGSTMLERVIAALCAAPEVARIVVVIERPDIVAALPRGSKPITALPAAAGPSASVAAALEVLGTPLLVTTADHALLRPEWVTEFLSTDSSGADALIAVARSEAVLAAAPDTQRTWLRFSDGHYSGCNLFLLRTPLAAGIVRLWQQIEAERKRPLALVQRLGFTYALRYRLGRLSFGQALSRLGALSGAKLKLAVLADGRAAIDVDKPADLDLVRRLIGQEES